MKAAKLGEMPICEIIVEGRSREEMGDIEGLAESIREKGVIQPVTVDQMGKLLAGGRRLEAAKLAGLLNIPVIVRSVIGDIDPLEIELYENFFRKDFTWQEHSKLLQRIDAKYKEQNIDWSGRKTAQLLGVSAMSVSRHLQLAAAMEVIPEIAECKTQDEAWKKLKGIEEHIVTTELRARQDERMQKGSGQQGIMTTLRIADANYRVGDFFSASKDLKTGGLIHFIECDPPYGVNIITKKENLGTGSETQESQDFGEYNEIPENDYPPFLERLCKELYRVANADCWMVFWHGSVWAAEVYRQLSIAGWHVDAIPGIWFKHTGQTLQPDYLLARCFEPFFVCRKGTPRISRRGRSNVFDFPGVPATQKYHPTQRPINLMIELLETFSFPGQICLVPFAGSGVTIRACYMTGNAAFGYDLSSKYKDKFLLACEEDLKKLDAGDDDGDGD